jgi:predicted transcriptional regulator
LQYDIIGLINYKDGEENFMGTYFKLQEIVDELNITPNKLAIMANVRPDTVYKICNNQIKRIHMDVIDDLLDTLNKVSKERELGRKYSITDILDYK